MRAALAQPAGDIGPCTLQNQRLVGTLMSGGKGPLEIEGV
jgi:hypothetical protein